jgi:hypothetical protein
MSGVAEDPCQRLDEQAEVAGMADTSVDATRGQPVPELNRYQSAGSVAKHEDRPEPKHAADSEQDDAEPIGACPRSQPCGVDHERERADQDEAGCPDCIEVEPGLRHNF